MQITKIEAQKKTGGRYSVFVDDEFAFGISESSLLSLKIYQGQPLTEQELETYKKQAQEDKIYSQALNLIAKRPRSEWEISSYLKRKDIPPSESQEIIARLKSKDFVNDKKFAEAWVQNRRILKPTSRRKLVQELRLKRVNSKVIEQVLQCDQEQVSELDVLIEEVKRKRRQTRYQDNLKLMQYLSRQGYRYEDIKNALSGDAG